LNYPVKLIREQTIAALAKMDYEVNKSEQILIQPFLEDEIRDFVYVSAALTDLYSLPQDDFLFQALKKLLSEKKQHIFDILAIIYTRKAVDLIRYNLMSENDENKGFAIEIADNVLSELHKMLLLPIFEGVSNIEIVRRYKYIFPQERYDFFDRIIDLIDAPLKTTGVFVKVEAIKKLQNFKQEKTFRVLNSAIVNPIDLIAETAAYTLFMIDRNEFDKTVDILKNKKQIIGDVLKNLENFENQQDFLILEKISMLKGLTNFKLLTNNQLYFAALNSKEIIVTIGKTIDFSKFEPTDIFLVVSGSLTSENQTLNQSDFFVKILSNDKNNLTFKAVEPTILFKIPLFVINTFLVQNFNFTEIILTYIINKSQNIDKATN
jgi:hypothetical protein